MRNKKAIIAFIIVILISVTAIIISACGTHSNPKASHNPYIECVGYNNLNKDLGTIYYLKDNYTNNMYIKYGSDGGLTPLYDKDGSIMTYDKWLSGTKEFDTMLY